jgi:hypothetical protein
VKVNISQEESLSNSQSIQSTSAECGSEQGICQSRNNVLNRDAWAGIASCSPLHVLIAKKPLLAAIESLDLLCADAGGRTDSGN